MGVLGIADESMGVLGIVCGIESVGVREIVWWVSEKLSEKLSADESMGVLGIVSVRRRFACRYLRSEQDG